MAKIQQPSPEHLRFRIEATTPDIFSLRWQGVELLRFEDCGARARASAEALRVFRADDLVRWGAPFALASRGHVLLHAASVEKNARLVCIVGEGGAGKSTLARVLAHRGWQMRGDDIVAVSQEGRANVDAERVVREWSARAASHALATGLVPYEELAQRLDHAKPSDWTGLCGIAVLALPRSPQRRFFLERLQGVALFQALVEQGFGGLPSPSAWQHQFRTYGGLCARVPTFRARAPEGLQALRTALAHLDVLLGS